MTRKRWALVGTGRCGLTDFAKPLSGELSSCTELVGVMDTNAARADAAVAWLGASVPCFTDFDRLLRDAKPEAVVIATPDDTHADYIVRTLNAGMQAFVTPPMCTSTEQCRQILQAAQKAPGRLVAASAVRYDPAWTSVRSILTQGRLGKLRHVRFEETLDRASGSEFFRHWPSRRSHSGGLQVHLAWRAFDLLHWWTGAKPILVQAQGALRFYGKSNPYHGRRCSDCPHTARCAFYADLAKDGLLGKLFFGSGADTLSASIAGASPARNETPRDGCVFDPAIDIEDQLDVLIELDNGVQASYSLVAHAAYQSTRVVLDGTQGRLEHQSGYATPQIPGIADAAKATQVLYTPHYPVLDVGAPGPETHANAHAKMLRELFTEEPSQSPWRQLIGAQDAIHVVRVGLAVTESIQTGRTMKVACSP